MSKSSTPLNTLLARIFETYRLTLNTDNPYRLVITQRLKLWAYCFLFIWSVLFAGFPTAAIGVFISDCSKQNNCQFIQLIQFLAVISPFILSGLLAAYIGLRKSVVFLDKENNVYRQETHTLLGVRQKTHALDQIESVKINKFYRRSHRHRYYAYQLVIYLHNHKPHKLSEMRDRQPLSRVLVQMQSFLGEKQNAL